MILILLLILLSGLGLAALFSASYHNAVIFRDDPFYFLKKQLMFLAVGTAGFFVASRISLDWIRRNLPVFLLLTLLLNLATFVPGIGRKTLGATRWLYFGGFSFQPSELSKLVLIFYLSSIFAKKEGRMHDTVNSVVPPLLVTGVFVALIFFQNDFSTALFLFLLSLIIFFIANVRMIYFILITVFTVPLAGIMLFTKEHRVERLITFLEPDLDPTGTGYQIIASQSALRNGGLWGAGLGRGMKKMGALPEVHSDFVFASLGEEIGFLGIFLVIVLFLLFAFRGYLVSLSCRDRFGYYLGFGLTTAILYQALFNMAVVVGLVPATGIPLPFFSAGGTSLLVCFVMTGLLVNLSRNRGSGSGEVL